ncbi:MAG: MFS transporter [Balneolales bacterium]|nr:MFS transporter [Balneolales bacterium]
MESQKKDTADRLYDILTDDELRSCEAIPEEACTEVPRNFTLNVVNGSSTKLAEEIISPGVTLPWILSAIGAPAFMAGLLVPIKNAGSLMPQLLVSGKIRAFPIRKYFWGGAALVQALCMLLMGVSVLLLPGVAASWSLIGLLLLFSVASGVASVAFKDVVAKTIPKGTRGQMLASRASFGGALSLAAGLILFFFVGEGAGSGTYAILFGVAAALWAVAAVLFFMIEEEPGAVEGGRSPVSEFTKGLEILKEDANFRIFVITRALLMAIPLATPFYVIIGKNSVDDSLAAFGLLIITNGLANIVSSPFWGRYSDRSSRKMMIVTAALGIGTGLYVLSFGLLPDSWQVMYAFVPVFFLNGMAHAGARLSRKTYLVDMAPEKERPLYVSLSNTLIGLFTIIAAGIGLIAEIFSIEALIIFFLAMMVLSALLSWRLKEV